MPAIGETLREARMRQRLDIADVEARTKIRAKYLRALENEEFGMLPGPTFVKTFLRTYAEALGLDAHLLLDQYRSTHERGEELEHLQPLGPPAAAGRERRHRRMPSGWTLAGVALLAIVIALAVIGSRDDDPDPKAERTERPATPAPPETEREERPPQPTRVRLRIAPVTPTYVCLDRGVGTEVIFESTLEEPMVFRGRRLRVNLGRTDVQLRVNGKAVEVPPGPNPVGFVFTPRATRELPVGNRPCA